MTGPRQQLAWLQDRITLSDMPSPPSNRQSHVDVAPLAGGATGPTDAHRRSSAGGFLLVLGSILLVLAAIAFVAFAWETLGPIGQVVTLFVIGAGCVESAIPLSRRLPGTAAAVSIVGSLIVAVATIATRFEGGSAISVGASLLLSLVAAVALASWGVRATRRAPAIAAVGQLTGSLGALLVLMLVVFAPVDDAISVDRVSGWVAISLTVGAVSLLAAARPLNMKLWPALAVVSLVGAALASAGFVTSLMTWRFDGVDQLTTASVLILSSLVVVGLSVVFSENAKLLLGLSLGFFGFSVILTLVTGLDMVTARPWASLLLLLDATLFALVIRSTSLAAVAVLRTRATNPALVCLLAAAAVGLALAPWHALPTFGDPRAASAWALDAWPVWRGVLSGLAFVGVLLAAAYIVERMVPDVQGNPAKHPLPLLTMLAAIAVWSFATFQDLATVALAPLGFSTNEDEQSAMLVSIGLGLAIPGLALLFLAAWKRTEAWAVWLGAGLVVVSTFLFVQPADINATLRPELLALMLATPAAVAGFLWWRLHLPEATPTWISVGPAVTLALAPSTMALAVDSLDRWATAVDPSRAYQLRLVGLLAVATALTLWGARSRLGGLFYPGAFVLLVIAVIGVVDLGRSMPQWVSFAIAGTALLLAGARWESMRRFGQHHVRWVSALR